MTSEFHSDWLPNQDAWCISNKLPIPPRQPKAEPDYIAGFGWKNGYSFVHFLSNVYAHLGELSQINGVQQLCHHYYLQNGSINAQTTAKRIKKFLGQL